MYLKNLAVAAALLAAPLANAHFIFLELSPDTPEVVQMRFAEEPLEDTPTALQEKALPMALTTSSGDPVPMATAEGASEGPVAADAALVSGSLEYGLLDRTEQGRGVFMLMYHAKGTRGVEPAGEAVGLAVEVVATVKDETITVTVLHGGKPFADAELDCVLPQELEHVTGKTGADGTATFPLTQDGWVGIRAMVPEEKSGTADGTAYDLVRHYSTLTFKHSADS